MIEESPRRRVAAPVALLAALALAAGGGSSPWAVRPGQPNGATERAAIPVSLASVQLERLELVALRAQPPREAPTR